MKIGLAVQFGVLVVLGAYCCFPNEASAGEKRSLDQIARAAMGLTPMEPGLEPEVPSEEPFNNREINRQRPYMRVACARFELDRRREVIVKLAEQLAEAGADCRACKAIGRLISGSCGSNKVSKDTPQGSYGMQQREPNAAAISALSTVFSELSEKSESREDIAQAVGRFTQLVVGDASLSPAARDYLGTIGDIMSAPFTDILAQRSTHEESTVGSSSAPILDPHAREQMLNDLF